MILKKLLIFRQFQPCNTYKKESDKYVYLEVIAILSLKISELAELAELTPPATGLNNISNVLITTYFFSSHNKQQSHRLQTAIQT